MPEPLVRAEDLCRRFGRRWALARVELEVRAGERFLVLGENGGGKTTLLRLLATALAPSRGRLELFGRDPYEDLDAARRGLALLTHLPALYEDLSARENLELVARIGGFPREVGHWLEFVGLDGRPDPVRTYSAGMRKRLAFARLLVQRPRLALLDEPYGQLDPSGQALVDRLVDRLAAEGTAVILASHQVERASRHAERALLLAGGLPRWEGPASQAPRAWAALEGGG